MLAVFQVSTVLLLGHFLLMVGREWTTENTHGQRKLQNIVYSKAESLVGIGGKDGEMRGQTQPPPNPKHGRKT